MSIGLFIDGSFMYKSFPYQIDYKELRKLIERELCDEVDEAYYFNSDDNTSKAAKFNNFLTVPPPSGPGLRVKIYWLSRKKLFWPQNLGGHPVLHPVDPNIQFELTQQKAVDVGLAYHMVRSFYKRHWTKLVLCAGDADLHEPVQNLVESENIDLYLVGSLRGISSELRPYAKRIFEIDQEPVLSQIKRDLEQIPVVCQ